MTRIFTVRTPAEPVSNAGLALKKNRGQYEVATKFAFIFEPGSEGMQIKGVDGSPEFIRQQVEQSLKRLQTDHIEL